jgi:hypothetical protein
MAYLEVILSVLLDAGLACKPSAPMHEPSPPVVQVKKGPPSNVSTDAGSSNGSNELSAGLAVAGLQVDETRHFLDTLKSAIAQNDRHAICGLVSYPLQVHGMHSRQKVADKASCVRRFDHIFTAHLLEAIRNQRLEALSANSNGAMIGDGELWFAAICGDRACEKRTIKIFSVNN